MSSQGRTPVKWICVPFLAASHSLHFLSSISFTRSSGCPSTSTIRTLSLSARCIFLRTVLSFVAGSTSLGFSRSSATAMIALHPRSEARIRSTSWSMQHHTGLRPSWCRKSRYRSITPTSCLSSHSGSPNATANPFCGM